MYTVCMFVYTMYVCLFGVRDSLSDIIRILYLRKASASTVCECTCLWNSVCALCAPNYCTRPTSKISMLDLKTQPGSNVSVLV